MVHDYDPGTLGTLSRFGGSLQILLDPTILFTNQIQSVPQKEVEFSVYADNVSRTYVPTECGEITNIKLEMLFIVVGFFLVNTPVFRLHSFTSLGYISGI